MDEKKSPLNHEEFKLITQQERKFVENPIELLKMYKSPDAMARQHNNRIKYRTINAIQEIAWLCDKLPEDNIKKIFSNDRIADLFKITEKALDVAEWNPDTQIELILRRTSDNPLQTIISENDIEPRVLLLEKHLRQLLKHYLPETQIKQHENLKHKFFLPGITVGEINGLNAHLGVVIQKNELMRIFIEKNGLKEKFELEIEQSKKNDMIAVLKSGGVPDDKIDEMLTIML